MSRQHRLITASQFAEALIAAGVIESGDLVHRVVIDAKAGQAVKIYVERMGDERLLGVVFTLDGIEVTTGREAVSEPAAPV